MQDETCCVTGHREIPKYRLDYVRSELEREIAQALEEGYKHFITGFAEGADLLFAQIVHECRGQHQGIVLEAAIPYRGRLNKLDRAGRFLLQQCDGVNILSEQYRQGCFFERNRYMVNHSSRVIAIYDGRGKGGTFYTMAYAHTMMRDVRAIMI